MSIIEAALSKTITELKSWKALNDQQRLEVFQNAYFLLGRPFLEALTDIELSPKDILVKEETNFISLQVKDKKEILFYKTSKIPLGVECSCEASWNKKITKKSGLLCKYEALYVLWKYCFHHESETQKMSNVDSLLELLECIKE